MLQATQSPVSVRPGHVNTAVPSSQPSLSARPQLHHHSRQLLKHFLLRISLPRSASAGGADKPTAGSQVPAPAAGQKRSLKQKTAANLDSNPSRSKPSRSKPGPSSRPGPKGVQASKITHRQQQNTSQHSPRQEDSTAADGLPAAAAAPSGVANITPGPPIDAALLTARIKRSSTTHQLAGLLQQYSTQMDVLHVVACLHRTAAVHSVRHHTSLGLQDVHSAHTALRSVGPCVQFVDLSQREAAQQLPSPALAWSDDDTEGDLWSWTAAPGGRAGAEAHRRLVKLMAGRLLHLLLPHLQVLRWRELSSCLWSLATLRLIPTLHQGQHVLPLLLGHMKSREFSAADPQSVANTVWALGKLQVLPDSAWMQQLLLTIKRLAPVMDAQHLSATLWGLAVLGVRPSSSWMHSYLKQVHSNMLSAQALRTRSQGAVGVDASPRQLTLMQQYANLMYGLACIGTRPPSDGWMLRVWNNTIEMLDAAAVTGQAQPAATGAVSATALSAAAPEQPQATTTGVEGASRNASQDRAPHGAGLLPRHCSIILWSCAQLNIQPPGRWMTKMTAVIHKQVSAMSAQELSNTLWALGKLSALSSRRAAASAAAGPAGKAKRSADMFVPAPALITCLVSWVLRRRGAMKAQGLSNSLWALAKIHVALRTAPSQAAVQGDSVQPRDPTSLPGGVTSTWLQQLVLVVIPEVTPKTMESHFGMGQKRLGPNPEDAAPDQVLSGSSAGSEGLQLKVPSVLMVGRVLEGIESDDAQAEPEPAVIRVVGVSLARPSVTNSSPAQVTPQAVANTIWAAGVLGLDPGPLAMARLLAVVKVTRKQACWTVGSPCWRQVTQGCDQLGYSNLLQGLLPE